MRAVCSLGIDANVNDRNDICVGKDKICRASPSLCAVVLTIRASLRVRLCVQDREGPSVSPWYYAHFDEARYAR